jgi:hypothetical protein
VTPGKIYVPLPAADAELCHPVDGDDFERINVTINGVPRAAEWVPLRMQLIGMDEGRPLSESDSPWLGSHALIFRPKAIQALGPMLSDHGELLPLQCPTAEVSIFNPTRVVDVLDEAASQVLRFKSGKIMGVRKYAFRPEPLDGVHAFKIPNLRVSPTFVSESFVATWRSAGLRGLEFRLVWPAVEG